MRRIARGACALGVAALLAIAALMLVPPLLGYERYVITGRSMGSAVPRGSIAYEEVVPAGRIRVGDTITYRPPAAAAGRLVTHRVVWMERDRRGHRLLRTRGDANPARDPWTFWLGGRTQARVVFHVPLAGYALAALSVRWVRMLVIGVPALVIAFWAFAGLVPRRRRRRRRAADVSRAGSGAAQLF
jgi:signal peptidase I